MKLRNKKQSGFTLLELLVVVAILAIIAGAVISAISGQEERAGQGVALHTMGALENATRQQIVINEGLPDGLDSLLCADLSLAIADTGDVATPALMGANSGTLPNGDFAGGLAPGLIGDATTAATNEGKLALATLEGHDNGATIDEDESMVAALEDAGLLTLRYAEATACDATDGNVGNINGAASPNAGNDDGLDEVLAQRIFWEHSTEAGFGLDVAVEDDEDMPVAILREPAEIGQADGDIVAVFGVGNFTEMTTGQNTIISRGPVDGNVAGEGQYYSHFSLAIKVGENATSTGDGAAVDVTVANGATPVEPTIVAVLDSDGDNFDDEVAEFAGLEDE